MRYLRHESLFPGVEAVTEVATVGNYGGTSSGTVSIAVHSATLVRPYGPQLGTVTLYLDPRNIRSGGTNISRIHV